MCIRIFTVVQCNDCIQHVFLEGHAPIAHDSFSPQSSNAATHAFVSVTRFCTAHFGVWSSTRTATTCTATTRAAAQ